MCLRTDVNRLVRVGSASVRRPLVGGAALDGGEARADDDDIGWCGVRPSAVVLGVMPQRCTFLQSMLLPCG